MFKRYQRPWSIPLTLVALLVVADQVSKYWVVQTLGPEIMQKRIALIGDWVNIVYSHNTGIAFSLFQGMSQILTITSLLVTVGAVYFYWTRLPRSQFLPQLIIGLIVGGALGNIIDRVRLGYVVDFIQVGWWPVFNLADSLICVGAALLMLLFLRDELTRQHDNQQVVSA